MAFARWDPFRDLIAIQHRIERLSVASQHGWAPAVDLCETDVAFVMTAELPGVSRDQIDISFDDGRLTFRGRRDARVACEHYHQLERGHGEFSRTFALPPHVDPSLIAADLSGGVLTITVPKRP
ncbi:MAG: Hsp20/alpha crystallin family protein, partial [Acidobacteriota bacterium]|nr:Hsp20/alpha crystallin family protein [Acidobacteriota bacterium]